MAKPIYKKSELHAKFDDMAKNIFGMSQTEAIRKNVCLICGQSAKEFRDKRYKDEYRRSGTCQSCQDEILKREMPKEPDLPF